jgi:squalene-hopene/tetraprenyl-beta-curcumene cyclase
MRPLHFFGVLTAVWIAAGVLAPSRPKAADINPKSTEVNPETISDWSPKAAAAYLDEREAWWSTWSTAARDHGTYCVSCHTVLPYAMARPALRGALSETEAPAPERSLIENVTKRVRLWNEVAPFYTDEARGVPKSAESRGTESILNAMVLVANDAAGGKLSADSRLALANMWALQLKSGDARGAWDWLEFHNSPWEGNSQYYGATVAALATGMAPGDYRSTPEIQANLKLLREYLVRESGAQVLIDRVMLLWASTKLPGLLTAAQQKAIVDEALAKQQPDGGFSLTQFVSGWKRHDDSPLETKSDGLATGLVTYALEQAGDARSKAQIARARAWLIANQDKSEGRWLAYSLNKQRDLSTDIGRFMSDAATAYAVLALRDTK